MYLANPPRNIISRRWAGDSEAWVGVANDGGEVAARAKRGDLTGIDQAEESTATTFDILNNWAAILVLVMAMSESLPPVGSRIPLLFSYRDAIFGNGFLVEVAATNGRVLCGREEDGFWMYGVNPGGMSAVGANPDDAHVSFRRTFSKILVDIASEANDLDEFRHLAQEFFDQTNHGYEAEWLAAVDLVRADKITATGIPKAPAESKRSISIELKQIFNVQDNRAQFSPNIAA
jgi:hypothetical protein